MNYHPPADLLAGRVILITGAGRGIGRACALACAQHGACVILCGRTLSHLEAVYDEIGELKRAVEPLLLPLDLSGLKSDACEAVSKAIRKRFSMLSGLVHNAAILGPRTPIAHYPEDDFSAVMQVNVQAAFVLTKALLPLLGAAADASVIFTSSGVGRKGRAYWGAYSVSKFATEALMEICADEWENLGSIRCNSLDPGKTRTAMRALAYPAEDPATLVRAEELMPLYLYLLGPDSRRVNGQKFCASNWQYSSVAASD